MNVLRSLLQSSDVARLGWVLIHSLWEGGAVAAALVIVLMILRKRGPQARYVAGCVAMGGMVVLPAITFVVLRSSGEGRGEVKAPTAAVVALDSDSNVPWETPVAHGPTFQKAAERAVMFPSEGATLVGARATGESNAAATASKAAPAKTARITPQVVLPWVVLAWAAGVVLLSIWNIGGWVALRRMTTARTKPVGDDVLERVRRLCGKLNLGRGVRILESAVAESPLVIGVFRPVILVPVSVLCELSAAQLESILAHELAHVRRHDYLVNLIQSAIETLLFYHPAAWWISRRIRAEREKCCDDIALNVTGDRAGYARALAALAAVRGPILAPAASGGMLLARVRRVMGLPETDTVGKGKWAAGMVGLGVCLTVAVLAMGPMARGKARLTVQAATQPASRPSQSADAGGDLVGRVVLPDGSPLEGATIVAVRPGEAVFIRDGGVTQSGRGTEAVTSNATGEFTLAAERKSMRLIILHDKGFTELEPGVHPTPIVVKPWGTVEGEAFIGTKPAEGKAAQSRIYEFRNGLQDAIGIYASGRVGANGHFVIRHVPPGDNEVGMSLMLPIGGLTREYLDQASKVNVVAGETARVVVGGKGRPVIGRVAEPTEIGPIDLSSVELTLITKTHPPVHPNPANWKELSKEERAALLAKWQQTPEAQRYRKEVEGRRYFPIAVGMSGTFRAEDIPAGEYELGVKLWPSMGPSSRTWFNYEYAPMATATQDVVVPDMPGGRSDLDLNFGEIQLKTASRKEPADAGPKTELNGAVRQPDGRPAVGAVVAAIPEGMETFFPVTRGRFVNWSPEVPRTVTDDKGNYHLMANEGHFTLGIFHESGYAQVPYYDNGGRPEFKLTAWARTKGVLRDGQKVVAGVTLRAGSSAASSLGGRHLNYSSDVVTAADGSFAFDYLPALSEIDIARDVRFSAPNEPTVTRAHLAYVTLKPGEMGELSLGMEGRRVMGNIAIPAEWAGTGWVAEVKVIPDVVRNGDGRPTSWYAMSAHARLGWYENQLAHSPLRGVEYPVNVGIDGAFQVDHIPRGNYVLSVRLNSPTEAGRREEWASFAYAFAVDDVAGGRENPVKLPEISVEGEAVHPPGEQRRQDAKPEGADAVAMRPYRGFALAIRHIDDVTPYLKAIDDIADLGADTVSLIVESKQENSASTRIFLDSRDLPTDVQLGQIISRAHERKLRAVLTPIVLIEAPKGANEFRGTIHPEVWEDWWDSYREMIHHFASQAEASHVDLFVVGSELITTEVQVEQWTRTIRLVRKDYHGSITYCANWDHYLSIPFWDQLDLIGMNSYYDLGYDINGPQIQKNKASVEQLNQRWAELRATILGFGKKIKKPVVMLEVGWCSMGNAVTEPWDYTRRDAATDVEIQKGLYEGFLESWWGKPGFGGFVIWSWTPGENAGGPDDRSYTPQGKPAEKVIREWMAKPWKEPDLGK